MLYFQRLLPTGVRVASDIAELLLDLAISLTFDDYLSTHHLRNCYFCANILRDFMHRSDDAVVAAVVAAFGQLGIGCLISLPLGAL